MEHLSFPVRFAPGGFKRERQNSSDEVLSAVYALLVTEYGSLEDLDEFGIVDPTFSNVPLDTSQIGAAIAEWEQRAIPSIIESATPSEQEVRHIQILLDQRAKD